MQDIMEGYRGSCSDLGMLLKKPEGPGEILVEIIDCFTAGKNVKLIVQYLSARIFQVTVANE
jgi:hypothetical protein